MRQFTVPFQTIIAEKRGTEPYILVEVNWGKDGATNGVYADRDVMDDAPHDAYLRFEGRIVSIGAIDSSVSSKTGYSNSVNIVLSDTDGSLKKILDTLDIHKSPVTIYQAFKELHTSYKEPLFVGEINSPITWNEADRTLTFDAVTQTSAQEVGFSPEEGQFDFVSPDLVGSAWPLCFGTPIHVPATQIYQQTTGQLNTKLCIVDPTLRYKQEALYQTYGAQALIFAFYNGIYTAQSPLDPHELLGNYICAIKNKIKTLIECNTLRNKLTEAKRKSDEAPNDNALSRKVSDIEGMLTELETIFKQIGVRLKVIENQIQQAVYYVQVKNEAAKEAEKAMNGIREGSDKYNELLREICRQQQCTVSQVRIDGDFPITTGNQTIDLVINNIRWRGTYDGKVFTITAGPLAKYKNVPLGERIELDEECLDNNFEDLRTFWVEDVVYQLKDCWALVEDHEGYRHIIHVSEQTGTKCTFDLVKWNVDTGGSENTRGNNLIKTAVSIPQYMGPFGQPIPSGPVPQFNAPGGTAQTYVPGAALSAQAQGLDHDIAEMLEFSIGRDKNTLGQGVSGQTWANRLLNNEAWRRNAAALNDIMAREDQAVNLPFVQTGCNFYEQNPKQLSKAEKKALRQAIRDSRKAKNTAVAIPTVQEYNNLLVLQKLRNTSTTFSLIVFAQPEDKETYTITGPEINKILEVAAVPLESWLTDDIPWEEIPDEAFWSADAGSLVTGAEAGCAIYVANILPSTIKAVHAYQRNTAGERVLTQVPSSYYTKNENHSFGGNLYCTTLKFKLQLDKITGEEWENGIYVTLTSSVGPNVSDIIKHLILRYTDDGWDSTTFNAVRNKMRVGGLVGGAELYPANFALLERRDIYEQISEIAYQARCVVWKTLGTWYIKYLGEEPTEDATLVENDAIAESLSVSFTGTESIATKYTALWKPDYLPETDVNKVVLRNNVPKYGLVKEEHNFYIYNIQQLVVKSATFWMIRNANTWKYIKFSSPIINLKLEVWDTILLNFTSTFVANGPIKAVIEQIDYDLPNYTMTISAWVPVRMGEMTQYPFAWPGSAGQTLEWPLDSFVGGPQKAVNGALICQEL